MRERFLLKKNTEEKVVHIIDSYYFYSYFFI